MTELQETTVDTPNPEAAGSAPEAGAPESSEAPKGNREARYRTERNEARAALTAAEARIEALHTRELERLAGKHLSAPADLLGISGNSVSDYLTENGELDVERIQADALAMIQERPGLGLNSPAFDPTQGHHGSPGKGAPSWSSLLK